MLSQLTSTYFGDGIIYQIIIWFTFIVLILAANSTFTGFSQLAAIVAADGFLPRGLLNRGGSSRVLKWNNCFSLICLFTDYYFQCSYKCSHTIICNWSISIVYHRTIWFDKKMAEGKGESLAFEALCKHSWCSHYHCGCDNFCGD